MLKTGSVQKIVPKEMTRELPLLSVMHGLPDPILVFDRYLNFVFINHAAQLFFNLSEKKFFEKNVEDVFGRESFLFEAASNLIQEKSVKSFYDTSVQGREVYSVSFVKLELEELYVLSIHPKPKHVAAAWDEKTKYAFKSTEMFAQALAHEIKNPLAGIRGAAQLLNTSGLSKDDKELSVLIERETERIQRLVDKFNVFYEAPYAQYKQVNLHEVLHYVANIIQVSYGDLIQIEEDFDPSLPEVYGFFDHLVQVILNLSKNAVEAFPDKQGKIIMRSFYDTKALHHPERHQKLPLCIEIEDNGSGVLPDKLQTIFQPCFTTKTQGQGLGLSIVAKIIDDHGGLIKLESAPGRTVFRISFPMPANSEGA